MHTHIHTLDLEVVWIGKGWVPAWCLCCTTLCTGSCLCSGPSISMMDGVHAQLWLYNLVGHYLHVFSVPVKLRLMEESRWPGREDMSSAPALRFHAWTFTPRRTNREQRRTFPNVTHAIKSHLQGTMSRTPSILPPLLGRYHWIPECIHLSVKWLFPSWTNPDKLSVLQGKKRPLLSRERKKGWAMTERESERESCWHPFAHNRGNFLF